MEGSEITQWWLTTGGEVRVWVDPMVEEAKAKSLEEIIESNVTEQVEVINCEKEPVLIGSTDSLQPELVSQTLEKTASISNFQEEGSLTAKSQLLEICITNDWTRPSFVILKESSHQEMFISKVTIEVESISATLLECFSEPKPHKKAAVEHAAEAALWYLNHLGYLSKP